MKSMRTVLVVALMSLAPRHAFAGDIKFVANTSIKADSVSAVELKKVYLRERNTLGDGTRVEPVLARRGAAHQAFLKDFLNFDEGALQTHYRTLIFTGRGFMPKTLGSDAEIVAYVANTKGAIGYVSSESVVQGVKTIEITREENQPQRALLVRVEPEYPETLQMLHIGGTVRLRLTISPQGRAEHIEVIGGNPVLAEAAVAAVKKWVYAASHASTTIQVNIPFAPR